MNAVMELSRVGLRALSSCPHQALSAAVAAAAAVGAICGVPGCRDERWLMASYCRTKRDKNESQTSQMLAAL